jgi:phosphatidylserine decarboxylase
VWVSGSATLLAAFTVWFFRDPERRCPEGEGVVVAPADGRILSVEEVKEPLGLKGGALNDAALRVSIFMSPLNVHVNRVPATGRVVQVDYRRGRFHNAAAERASLMNEHNAVLLEAERTGKRLLCVQVAGFLARRILCWIEPGQMVRAGERFGLIRFGSRVDLYLPPGTRVQVSPGQRVRAGETVIAWLG